MCIDLPRVDYDKGKKLKKSDLEMIKEHNSKIKAGAVTPKEQLPAGYLKFVASKEKQENKEA